MTTKTEAICRYCLGAGATVALLSVVKDGRRACEARRMPCSYCDGSGTLTDEQRERVEKGERMRADRIARGLNQRQEAERLGISPRDLAYLENGRIP